MTTKKQQILWMSPLHLGSEHDLSIFKKEAQHLPFEPKTIQVDLGFPSIDKKVPPKTNIKIPHKKPRGGKLSKKQKEENKLLASERVTVEHAIARMKVYFILPIENRMHSTIKLDLCAELCAMRSNFKL